MVTRWSIVIALTFGCGFLFDRAGVPAAWILGAIVGSASLALYTSTELPVHSLLKRISRNLIAVMAAAPIVATSPEDLLHFILPGVVVSAVTVGIGIAGGMLLSRHEPAISRETGVLSMLAGGASIMPGLAETMGADFRYVTLSQYLRLLTVTITLPLLVPLMDVPRGTISHQEAPYELIPLLAIGAIVLVAEPLATLLRFPAPGIIGPLGLTILLAQFFPHPSALALPTELKIFTFVIIGWTAGGMLSIPALKFFAKQLPATFIFIFLLLGSCAIMAIGIMHWLDTSYFEAYLATSPGGLETVLALADEFDAGPSIAAIQVIRLIAILLVAGYLPKILARRIW